jgi:Protein of unknown function (DUF2726)
MDMLKSPSWMMAALVVLVLAVLMLSLWWRSSRPLPANSTRLFRMEDWQPRTMRPLTPAELRLLLQLRKALPECLLMPQVALARFLSVAQNRSYNQWFGSVGRRCVDFLVCTEQGEVLGVIQLQSSKAGKPPSEGTERKLKALSMARIPVWPMASEPLPDVQTLRSLVLPELQAAEQHSQLHSQQHDESEWQATRLEPRGTNPKKVAPAPAPAPDDERWNQVWPNEEARSSAFLDDMSMIEMPPLVIKGSGRSATGRI